MGERALEVASGVACLAAAAGCLLVAARRGAGVLLPGRPAAADRVLATGLGSLVLAAWSVAGLGAVGHLSRTGLLLVALAVAVVARALPRSVASGPALVPSGRRSLVFAAPWLLAAAPLALDLWTRLPAPPIDWDALTYHLYLPARWLQEGWIFHVPTVFGDNAAAFAPQNGALLFAWQLALLGGDALTNAWQLLPALATGLALYRSGVLWGVRRESAALTVAALFWMTPMRQATFSATVDVLTFSAWTLGLHWLFVGLADRQRSAPVACGLALGFAAGTKVIGLPLVAPPLVVLGLALALRRSWSGLAGLAAASMAAGGWWYVRSWWLYGNPLFPLAWSLGPLELAGAYDLQAAGHHFYLADPLERVRVLLHNWGLPACAFTAAGLLALAGGAWGRTRRRRGAPLALGLAVYWGWFCLLRLPHSSETRFFLPLLLLGLLGCMLPLDALLRRSRRLARLAWTALLLATPWLDDALLREWQGYWAALHAAGSGVASWAALGGLAGLALAAAMALRHPRARRVAALATGVITAVAVGVAQLRSERSRPVFYARAPFGSWAEAFTLAGEAGRPLRIAYTGLNLPYPLMGARLEHRVVYCNIQGDAGDGFYEFWRRTPRLYPQHKPGLYRGRGDYERWLGHLDAERIDLLVVFALHPSERSYVWTTPEGFPVERVWARQHPERFERVAGGRGFEAYRLRPPSGAG